MFDREQEQSVEGGVAIQAGGNVTYTANGIPPEQALGTLLQLFYDNFPKLEAIASETAEKRAETITKQYLETTTKRFPAGYAQLQDPGFQSALLTVQRAYARSGDSALGDILVDLLVERSKEEERSVLLVTLDEALEATHKLTNSEHSLLSFMFFVMNAQELDFSDVGAYNRFLDCTIQPLLSDITHIIKDPLTLKRLASIGCVTYGFIPDDRLYDGYSWAYRFLVQRKHLFSCGISREEAELYSPEVQQRFFKTCFTDSSRFQVNVRTQDDLGEMLDQYDIPEEKRPDLRRAFNCKEQPWEKIFPLIRPYLYEVLEAANDHWSTRLALTGTGIAIGHAKMKHYCPDLPNLSKWVK